MFQILPHSGIIELKMFRFGTNIEKILGLLPHFSYGALWGTWNRKGSYNARATKFEKALRMSTDGRQTKCNSREYHPFQ